MVTGSREPVRQYRVEAGAWWQVLGVPPGQLGWGYWRERYVFVLDVLTLLERLTGKQVSEYARDVEAREVLTRHRRGLGRDRMIDAVAMEGEEMNWRFLGVAGRRVVEGMQQRG